MDGLLGIFQSNSINNNLPLFLKALGEHQCFQQASCGRTEFISHLTELLSKAKTRNSGLLLLDSIIKQCSLDVLEQKGTLWASFCIKTCGQSNAASLVPLASKSLGLLIEKSIDIPELSKAFSGHLLANFFETLKNTQHCNYYSVLGCIEIAIRTSPGVCGPHRGTLEKFIGKFVDFKEMETVHLAGHCLHLLQQIRGGNTTGISFKEAWQKLQLNLLGSLHEIFNNIFTEVSEFFDDSGIADKLNVPDLELSDEPSYRTSQLFIRFRNLISYLIIALTEPFPAAKSIMPRKILNLIQRGLAVNCNILLRAPSSNNLAVGALLPEIHIILFDLLNAMILTLKSNLAPYSNTILGCVLESLKWTYAGKSSGFTKPYSSLRVAVYDTLSLWCETMKSSSCCELIADHVIEQIKNDVMFFENEVILQVISGGKKYMSRKARRMLHKAQNEKSNIAEMHSKAFNPHNTKIIYSDECNQVVCAAALNCLKNLILSSLLFLKPVTVQELTDSISSIAIHIVTNNPNVKTDLYSSSICRQNLYDVLYAFVHRPHRLSPPPLQLVVEILNIAQVNDYNMFVRSKCNANLQGIEKILHPQKESLYFPINKEELRNTIKNRREQLFEKQSRKNEQSEEVEEDNDNDENDEAILESDDESNEEVDQADVAQVDLTREDLDDAGAGEKVAASKFVDLSHDKEVAVFPEFVTSSDSNDKLTAGNPVNDIDETSIPVKKRRHTFVISDDNCKSDNVEDFTITEPSTPKKPKEYTETHSDRESGSTDIVTSSTQSSEVMVNELIADFINELAE